jgi:hypothetical protein
MFAPLFEFKAVPPIALTFNKKEDNFKGIV